MSLSLTVFAVSASKWSVVYSLTHVSELPHKNATGFYNISLSLPIICDFFNMTVG